MALHLFHGFFILVLLALGNKVLVQSSCHTSHCRNKPLWMCSLPACTSGYLWLDGNNLTGTIPNGISNMANLKALWLYGNQLTGTIPNSILSMTNLHTLSLHHNRLTGTISNGFSSLTKLDELALAYNRLTGTIPNGISSLTNLHSLRLQINQLTGTIPNSISKLTKIQFLFLAYNQLTGTIPNGISSMKHLHTLYLYYTKVNGPVPKGLCSKVFRECHLPQTACLPKACSQTQSLCGVESRCTGTPVVNHCRGANCGGDQSRCVNSNAGFTCVCGAGWTGGGFQKICTRDHCDGVTCGGRSTCTSGPKGYSCDCHHASGWTGGGLNTRCTGTPTVPSLEMKLDHMQRFVADVPLFIKGVGLHNFPSVVDTGSTGLAAVFPGDITVQRTTRSCNDFQACIEDSEGFFFQKCFGDSTGYRVQSYMLAATMTLDGKTAKVSYGRVRKVFDCDGSMYDRETRKYTNILGLGSHGEKTCTASKRDLLSDFTKAAKLPALFSLRSVSGTGAGRLYIGGSEDVWDGVTTFAPLVVDVQGHYVIRLSGFEISSGQSKGQPVKLSKVTEVILDSGTSTSIVVSSNLMQSWLKALKATCGGDWVAGAPLSASLLVTEKSYQQYRCNQPSTNWFKHQISLVFGSTKTPLLPVTNFVSHDPKTGLYANVLFRSTTDLDAVSILGINFFTNNWVEFNLDVNHVRFTDPTSKESKWGDWGKCQCSGKRTRSCSDEWCVGPTVRACKAEGCAFSCPATCASIGAGGHSEKQTCDFWVAKGNTCQSLENSHGCDCSGCACVESRDGEVAWSNWSPCTVTCGKGIQGRGTQIVKAPTGDGKVRQPSGASLRKCHQRDCSNDTCENTSCLSIAFCADCPNFKSCTACYPGCTLRTKQRGFSDCKAPGSPWGYPNEDGSGGTVVVHGRNLRNGSSRV